MIKSWASTKLEALSLSSARLGNWDPTWAILLLQDTSPTRPLRTINKDNCKWLFHLTLSPEIKIKLGECNPDSSLHVQLLPLPVDRCLPDFTVTFDFAVMATPHLVKVCHEILSEAKVNFHGNLRAIPCFQMMSLSVNTLEWSLNSLSGQRTADHSQSQREVETNVKQIFKIKGSFIPIHLFVNS